MLTAILSGIGVGLLLEILGGLGVGGHALAVARAMAVLRQVAALDGRLRQESGKEREESRRDEE